MDLTNLSKTARAKALETSEKLVVRTIENGTPVARWIVPAILDDATERVTAKVELYRSLGYTVEFVMISGKAA